MALTIKEVKKNAKGIGFVIPVMFTGKTSLVTIYSLITNAYLNVINNDGMVNEDVWVIGDCGVISGEPLLQLLKVRPDHKLTRYCQFTCLLVAAQKGKYLTKVLNKIAKD
ncbi:hypothetical protein C0993_008597 [Termitomyces sp. T159_Od127]|nr:hypothetical protein C0993_008597 [Termitomyces sp. T159_Od127]